MSDVAEVRIRTVTDEHGSVYADRNDIIVLVRELESRIDSADARAVCQQMIVALRGLV